METTKGFKKYMRLYGPHFTKLLCEFAVDMMEDDNGQITPFTKAEIEQKMQQQNVKLQYNKYEDFVYVANMCKADFLGSSIIDDKHMALYIKDVIDDIDAPDGLVFNRFYADMCYCGIAIDWEEML